MGKGRVEAFSDGVIAILITIMVLEMKAPHGRDPHALRPLLPVFLAYVLSYVNLAIYWNNHHHLFQLVRHVDGRVLWANVHLLFWLSLVPVSTAWMGEEFAAVPVALYGGVLLMAGVAYFILVRTLVRRHGPSSPLATAVGSDFKGKLSVAIYAPAIPMAWIEPRVSCALFILVALMWLVPDLRMERALDRPGEGE
jgi:TMEM175 potassium channel family protein